MYLKYSYINTVTFIWQINYCFYIYCQTKLYFLSKKDCWDFFLFPAVIFPYFFALTKYPPVNNKNLDHLSGFYISPPVFNIMRTSTWPVYRNRHGTNGTKSRRASHIFTKSLRSVNTGTCWEGSNDMLTKREHEQHRAFIKKDSKLQEE